MYVVYTTCITFFQIEIVENGLLIHGQLAPLEVQPLHHRLAERVVQLKQNLRAPPPPESIVKYECYTNHRNSINIV